MLKLLKGMKRRGNDVNNVNKRHEVQFILYASSDSSCRHQQAPKPVFAECPDGQEGPRWGQAVRLTL